MSSLQITLCLAFVLAAYGVAARFDEDAARTDREVSAAPQDPAKATLRRGDAPPRPNPPTAPMDAEPATTEVAP